LGKSSKKLAKNQKTNKLIELKNQIENCKAIGKYNEALEIVVQLLELKCYDVEVLFMAAELYFLEKDYERCAVWINKTLEFDSTHVGARILLSQICFLQNRQQDGLSVLEFVLSGKKSLMVDQTDQIKALIMSSGLICEVISDTYPHIASFIIANNIQSAESVDLKKIELEEVVVDANPVQTQELSTSLVQDLKKEIQVKKISLQEKIKLYNFSAGQAYYENRFDDAKVLLLAALELDEYSLETLRNLVLLMKVQGDKVLALQYAAKLPTTDFALLQFIKEDKLKKSSIESRFFHYF